MNKQAENRLPETFARYADGRINISAACMSGHIVNLDLAEALVMERRALEGKASDLEQVIQERDEAVRLLREVYGLADSFEPVLSHICPAGCLPTPGQERLASILSRPFALIYAFLSNLDNRNG